MPKTIAMRARTAYIGDASLSEIAREFPQPSRDQFKYLKETENWDKHKRLDEEELGQAVYETMQSDKLKLQQALHHLAEQAYQKVCEGVSR